jgi:hypothetical protein
MGSALHWLAIEQMLAKEDLQVFDFTEGQDDHRRLLARHRRPCVM